MRYFDAAGEWRSEQQRRVRESQDRLAARRPNLGANAQEFDVVSLMRVVEGEHADGHRVEFASETIGTVVPVAQNAEAYYVEVVAPSGATEGFIWATPEQVRLVSRHASRD